MNETENIEKKIEPENLENKNEKEEKKQEKKDEGINLDTIFSKSNIIFLVWFLAIYFIIYFVLKLFLKENIGSFVGYTFDLIMFGILIVVLIAWYYSTDANKRDEMATTSLNSIGNFLKEKMSIFIVIIFIIVLYVAAYLIGLPMDTNKPITFVIIETISWGLFVILLFVVFFEYVFGFSLIDEISRLWNKSKKEEEDEKKDEKPKPTTTEEVFNISNNLYTYDDAQSICSSYGARLATYDEIEQAYNKGAEWCSYGWSDGQMIFFPTQKSTWDKLQKTKDHKNDCGRPGVNGGYIKNPYVRFGVNCYGKKPAATNVDLNRMNKNKNILYPKTEKDLLLESKVNFWKENADKLLNVNSFNKDKWSQF
jgi:flagellar basal body-associated protein FliL